jgi:hypothetical protein
VQPFTSSDFLEEQVNCHKISLATADSNIEGTVTVSNSGSGLSSYPDNVLLQNHLSKPP